MPDVTRCIITDCPNVGINEITIKFKDSETTGRICHIHHDELVERTARARRYLSCPSCGYNVDTWLAGTTAAHRTDKGVMHADCYLYERDQGHSSPLQRPAHPVFVEGSVRPDSEYERDQDAERSEAAPTQRPTGSS